MASGVRERKKPIKKEPIMIGGIMENIRIAHKINLLFFRKKSIMRINGRQFHIGKLYYVMAFFAFFFCINSMTAIASQLGKKEIVFSMSPKGYPPYTIRGNDNKNHGILLDVLRTVASKYDYVVRVVIYPEKRETKLLEIGKIDARAKAKEWVKNPENYTFTDPIVEHSDFLIFLKETPLKFNKIEDLFGKKIGTILGYTYPFFTPYFDDSRIHRKDTVNQKAMLRMVVAKRTDGAIINKLVALWSIKQDQRWQGKFIFSERTVGSVGYRLMFTNKVLLPISCRKPDRFST